MIPYELIIPSASRPHLLDEVLATLFAHLDHLPARVLLHDDAVFPGKQSLVAEVLRERVPSQIPTLVLTDDPPIHHGPALKTLLDRVSTEYVLYSQDDHRVVRDLPVGPALQLLDQHGLNQIRFNKRTTADRKGREGEEFYKVEQRYRCHGLDPSWISWGKPGVAAPQIRLSSGEVIIGPDQTEDPMAVPLCIADHWYFQTGVWRVAAIKPVLDWWTSRPDIGAFSEHMEVKVNQTFNGEWAKQHGDLGPEVPILTPDDGLWNDPLVRARVHKTFIWGRIAEPQFIAHIGTDPKDWALERSNRDPIGKK
jgi:hypothetical protein